MAAKAEIINRDPYAAVQMHQMEIDGRKTDKWAVLMQDEKGIMRDIPSVQATHSADYTLVPNTQVHALIADVLTRTGKQFEPVPTWGDGHSRSIFWNGKSYSEKWYSKEIAADIGDHALAFGVEAMNSYDGSQPVGMRFFAMHCLCSNQFYWSNMMGEFIFKHVNREAGINLTENVDDTLRLIRNQVDGFMKAVPAFRQLTKTRVETLPAFLEMRQDMNKKFWKASRDSEVLDELAGCGITQRMGIPQMQGSQDSLWRILNAYTAVCTHSVGGWNGSNLSNMTTDYMIARAMVTAKA